jgi:hypothetical protein
MLTCYNIFFLKTSHTVHWITFSWVQLLVEGICFFLLLLLKYENAILKNKNKETLYAAPLRLHLQYKEI